MNTTPVEKIALLLPNVARDQHPVIWSTVEEYLPSLTEDQRATVVSVIVHTSRLSYQLGMQSIIAQMTELQHKA